MWNNIKNEADLQEFMNIHQGFHDSCIKEFKYISGAYIEGKWMHPVNDQRILKLVIQGPFEHGHAVEIEFSGLKSLRYFPCDDDYTCEILDSTVILKDDCIYWCDCGGLTEEDVETEAYQGFAVCAAKARWRAASEYTGSKEVYTSV